MKVKNGLMLLLTTIMTVAAITACGDATATSGNNVASDNEATVSGNGAVSVNAASIDFEDGNYGFVRMNLMKGNPDDSILSMAEYNGSKALFVENVSGGNMYIGINISAMLGRKITQLSTITMDIGTEYPDGSFSACSGYMYAYYSNSNEEAKLDAWSVYLPDQNPKTAVFDVSGINFVMGTDNYIMISKETDNGDTPCSMYIDNICFYDDAGNLLIGNTSVDFGEPVGFESFGKDTSNLCGMTAPVIFDWFTASVAAWIQNGYDMNEEMLAALVPGSVVEIEYTSETGDMWLAFPDAAGGFARVGVGNIDESGSSAAFYNNSRNVCQITYEQIVEVLGDNQADWGARMQCESSGVWEVTSLKIGQQAPNYGLSDAVEFEGFTTSSGSWNQSGYNMPEEILAALVPGSVVEIKYTSETGNMWLVFPDASIGWTRVGVGNIDESGSSPAVFDGYTCYVTYEQIVEKCGEDQADWGARMQCESSGAWEVYSVRVGQASEFAMVNESVNFEGFSTSDVAWKQSGFNMPEEILAALVPGSVVTIQYTSETGDMWLVFPDASVGWTRVGVGNIDESGSSPAVFNGSVSQVTYEQIVEKCGENQADWGARMQCESSGAWEVYSITVGQGNN